jgi:DNA-binding response OmpR family regulator
MNVLVVDDDADARSLLRDLLASAGHRVTGAASVLEAILYVEMQRFDLVLLDLSMPGMDGLQFAEFMSCHWNTFDTPVLIVSARGDPESRSLARVYNCAGFLAKPFGAAELFDAIAAVPERDRSRQGT